MNIREKLIEIALEWESNFVVGPQITSALSEYDAAKLLGMTDQEYSDAMRGRTAVSKGYDFQFKSLRIQVKANRPSGKPGSKVTKVGKANNYDWDRLIWILYDQKYCVQEAWNWPVEKYQLEFDSVNRIHPNDMRRGERIK